MENQLFSEGIKNIDIEDYIWWRMPWPDNSLYPEPKNGDQKEGITKLVTSPKLLEFVRNNENVIFCNLVHKIHKDIEIKGEKIENKRYLSNYFPLTSEKILICTNHDVGFKKEDGYIVAKNPVGSFQKNNIVEKCKVIDEKVKRIYTKALGIKDDPCFRPLPNGLSGEETFDYIGYIKDRIKSIDITKSLGHKNLLLVTDWVDWTHNDRAKLKERFRNVEWTTLGTGYGENYIKEIYNHKFNLSPIGNCADSHRTWESLYLGTIPIVLKSPEMSWFDDLPILQVDSWDDINKEFLKQKYKEIHSKKWPMYKLKISYWIDIMKKDIGDYNV